MYHVVLDNFLCRTRQNIVCDDAAEGVGHDGDLATVGLEVGVPLDEHLVEPVQLLLQDLPNLHSEKVERERDNFTLMLNLKVILTQALSDEKSTATYISFYKFIYSAVYP